MQPLPRCVKKKKNTVKKQILFFHLPRSDEVTELEYMSIQLRGQDSAKGESQQQTVSSRQFWHS